MRIALCMSPMIPVPPPLYGGAERVAVVMIDQLHKRGHNVVLFGNHNSKVPVEDLVSPSGERAEQMSGEAQYPWLFHSYVKQHGPFDCLIDRGTSHLLMDKRYSVKPKGFAVMGGDPFKKYPHDTIRNRVYVSKEFAHFCGCDSHPALYNPVCCHPERLPLCEGERKDALYIGRVSHFKGLEKAALACKQIGLKFRVIGPVDGYQGAEYMKNRLLPVGIVNYCGVLGSDADDRADAFGSAGVFLHPSLVVDADPGAPKEAMLYGTPVVGSPLGGLHKRIIEGTNGFIACSVNDYVEAIPKALALNRKAVRESMLQQVDPDRYGDELEALCKRAAEGEEW